MKMRLSTKFRVAMGQVGLMTSLLLVAVMFGLVPDRQTAIRHGRAVLAEAIVVKATAYFTPSDINGLESILDVFVERNEDLLSAAVRRRDAVTVVTIGEHEDNWRAMLGEFSSNSQVRVPIFSGEKRWGQLELRFKTTNQFMGFNLSQSQVIPLILFMSLSSFIVFYFYLSKMLKHLDPTAAIPPRVRSAFDTLAEGLLVVDLGGQIVLANQAFSETVGEEFNQLLGRRAQEFPWETADGLPLSHDEAPWTKCIQTGDAQRNAEVHLVDHEGVRRTFNANCTAVMSAGGKHGGVLIGLDDVTQLEQKKKELGEAKDAADAANKAKSEFLANMSHEIRTPMNAILGFTDALRRGYGSQQDPRKYLNTIHSSGKHLLELINDILDLSKVESGLLEVERVPCSPHLMVRDVLQVLAVKANEKGIALSFEADGSIPETICSDPSRIRQIVTNLVGNAIKFTEEGGVNVVLRLVPDDHPKLQIDVTDSGIGMTQEHMDRIFDPFAQADSSVTRRFGGTGLGLTISRNLAEALEGSITVASNPGQGSVFSLTVDTGSLKGIAMIQPDKLDCYEEEVETRYVRWRFNSQRVLVVDDGPENRELVKVVLEEVRLHVETAENGKIGSEMALQQPFDLILMDMQMPVMDGYAATRLLRENGITIPIYALTAHAMKGFEKNCLDAGCSGFLTKPIDIDLLLETVGDIFEGEKYEDGPPIPNLPVSPNLLSESALVSSLPSDIPEFATIVHSFVVRLNDVLQNMDDALAKRDFEKLRELAHWLIGSGGTVGFKEFTEPATRMEQSAIREDLHQLSLLLPELRNLSTRIQLPVEAVESACSSSVSQIETEENEPLISTLPINIPRFRDIVETFVPHLYNKMQEMIDSWQEKNYTKLAELAHWLEGVGGTVGYNDFTVPSRALEASARDNCNEGIAKALNELCLLASRIQVETHDPVTDCIASDQTSLVSPINAGSVESVNSV